MRNGYRSRRGRSAIARSVMRGTESSSFTNRPQGGGTSVKWGSAPSATGFNTLYYRTSDSRVLPDPTNYRFRTNYRLIRK